MKIIVSPAKKMRWDPDSLPAEALPQFTEEAREILGCLQSMSPAELQALWGCNDKIARQNVERLRTMDLDTALTPAILSYDGIAYQHMAPGVFTDEEFAYVQSRLRILSGFYGILRPMDGVRPYRLEMQAKLSVRGSRDLYDYWGRKLYDALMDSDRILINLASKEYSRCIADYLTPKDTFITCQFTQEVKGRLVQKATLAKMARGEMVRFLAETQADRPEAMKKFDRMGFLFREDLSDNAEYIFQQLPQSGRNHP